MISKLKPWACIISCQHGGVLGEQPAGRRGRGGRAALGRRGESEEEANSKSSCATTDSGYDGMTTPTPRRRRRTANKTWGSDEESCPVIVYVPRSRRRRRRPPASAPRLTDTSDQPWVRRQPASFSAVSVCVNVHKCKLGSVVVTDGDVQGAASASEAPVTSRGSAPPARCVARRGCVSEFARYCPLPAGRGRTAAAAASPPPASSSPRPAAGLNLVLLPKVGPPCRAGFGSAGLAVRAGRGVRAGDSRWPPTRDRRPAGAELSSELSGANPLRIIKSADASTLSPLRHLLAAAESFSCCSARHSRGGGGRPACVHACVQARYRPPRYETE